MPTIYLLGRVLPTAMNLTVGNIPSGSVREESLDLDMHFDTQIVNGTFVVKCDLNRYEVANLQTISARAYAAIRTPINMVVFSSGYGISAIIDTIIRPDGSIGTFLSTDSNISGICTAFKAFSEITADQEEFRALLITLMEDPLLAKCLDDLVVAITVPNQAPINCGRAIEGIRNLITPNESDRKRAWPLMREALNLEESYLTLITKYSEGPRHGHHAPNVPDTSIEVVKRSWTIMNRYLEYRKRGNQKLSSIDFPILPSS